jgi:hypothetical protein
MIALDASAGVNANATAVGAGCRFGERISKRVCENLMCKFYRFANNASADS